VITSCTVVLFTRAFTLIAMNTTLIPFVLCIGSQIGIDWLLLSRLLTASRTAPMGLWRPGGLWFDAHVRRPDHESFPCPSFEISE
jgi:hypothetical protein